MEIEQSVNAPLRPEGNSRCPTHSHKKVTFVCYDCNSLICGKCVTSLHHGHIMEELSDAMPSIRNKLDLSITSMESEQLPKVQSCIDLSEQRLIDNAKQIKDIVNVMKSQGNKCKDEIDDMIDECVSVCEKLGQSNMEQLINYMAKHKARMLDLTEQIKHRRQALLSGSNVVMFDSLGNEPCYDAIEWPSLHTAQFTPCEVVTDFLKQALGQLTTSADSHQSPNYHCHPSSDSVSHRTPSKTSERLSDKPPKSANGDKKLEQTDQAPSSKEHSNHKVTVRQSSQQHVGLRSGRHPPRPASERVRVKSPNRQARPHSRTAIFKRRNSMDAPSSIHRFLSARPSTSSDIRPMITEKSSPLKRDSLVSTSLYRRHERRSMSLPSEQKPEPAPSAPSPSFLQAIMSSSHDPKPPNDPLPHKNTSLSQDPSPQNPEPSQNDGVCPKETKQRKPKISSQISKEPDVPVTKVHEMLPQNTSEENLSSSNDEPETVQVPSPKPERKRKAFSQRNVHHPVILSQFPSPCAITSICLTSEGHAWTCNEESRVLTLVGNAGDVIKTVTCKANVNDISMSPKTRHLWYCTWKCRVEELDPETDTCTRRFTTDAWPRCMCVTDKEQILVGTENKITLYDVDGQVLLWTDTELSGVMRPTRLTQCPLTGNIAFLEKTSFQGEGKDNGYVVVLDNELSVNFRYTGECENSNSEASTYFDPFDVKYDEKGHLLVGDFTSNTLDLVTGTGNHIRTLLTDTGSSQAIGIHTDNVIWAAFRSENDLSHVKILKY